MPDRAKRLTVRCAIESRRRSEPLDATASRVRRWLVIEQPGPWGKEALTASRLDRVVAEDIETMAARTGVRVLLARRIPGPPGPQPRRVFLAHSGPERNWLEQLDVDDPAEVADLDLGALGFPEPPGIGAPGPPSVHLVCTNGRHDPCCADFGRPVVRALAAAGAPDVWECSHVGGDRFAANIVCLPQGVYFGRVEPESAAALIDGYRRGSLDLECYRGRSCFPPVVQAAEIFARRHLHERRIDGLTVLSAEPAGAHRSTVRLLQRAERHEVLGVAVTVERERAESAPLTCTASEPARPWRYELVEVRSL